MKQTEGIHAQIRRCDLFILYESLGKEHEYHRANDCANVIVCHPAPDRLTVRGLDHGRQVFRMNAVEFVMTVFD